MVKNKKTSSGKIKLIHTEGATCRIPAKVDYIPLVIEEAFDYFETRGIGEECWHKLNSSLSEVLNNAILHGCNSTSNPHIEITWDWTDENIHVSVTDPGKADWDASPELPSDPMAEGGRGLFLIHKMTDYVQHENSSLGHTIKFRIYSGKQLTERKSDADLEETLVSMTEELSTSYENLAALFRFAEMLATSPSFDNLVKQILDQLINLLPATNAHLRICSPSKDLLSTCHVGFISPSTAGKIASSSSSLESVAFKSHTEKSVDDCSKLSISDPLYADDRMAFVCPVLFRENIIGTLAVQKEISLPFFSAGQMSVIRTVSEFIGIAHTNAQLLQHQKLQERAMRELEIAADIQRSLLPRNLPEGDSYLIHGICESASLVGGDFFDVIELPDGNLFLMIADVMGKSIPAALLSTTLRTAIHARIEMAGTPGKLLTDVNRQLFPDLDRVNMFITTQVVHIDLKKYTFSTANAGHCPLLYKKSYSPNVQQVDTSGVPLGIHPTEEYVETTVQMEPEDRIVLITDGMYEIFNQKREILGFDGFLEKLKHAWKLEPKPLCHHLISTIQEYSHFTNALDDQTMLAFELLPPKKP